MNRYPPHQHPSLPHTTGFPLILLREGPSSTSEAVALIVLLAPVQPDNREFFATFHTLATPRVRRDPETQAETRMPQVSPHFNKSFDRDLSKVITVNTQHQQPPPYRRAKERGGFAEAPRG